MKVTVCFGPVRVVVPCGDGDILIRDLTRQAIHRYKKAVGKSAGSWVAVHSLQSREGGILDPDDRLFDVADDREQIVASFDDGDGHHHHHGGDGASGSSVGTPSPDIFQGTGSGLQDKYRNDIEVTTEQIASGIPGIPAPLQVRRGSEPALNQLLPNTASSNGHLGGGLPPVSETNSKRWSAAPIITEPNERHGPSKKDDRDRVLSNGHGSDKWRAHMEEEDDDLPPRLAVPFSRDGSNRLSMQFLGDSAGGMRWADAAEKAASNRVQSLSLPRESRRKDPLGQATPPDNLRHSDNTEYIVLDTESGALGIHVVPDYDNLGKDRGLLVQGIEPGGRVDRDGRLAVYDRIIEINGRNLLDQPFHVVQDIFRESLRSSELRLRVVKHRSGLKKPPPPVYPKPPAPGHFLNSNAVPSAPSSADKENVAMVEVEEKSGTGSKVATVSPTKKLPATGTLQSANTRKIGRKMELELVKGPHGLGFSITTRDNPAGGNCPIYIKNILPKGAAVEDGRLRPGDRLLAVDGVELTGKSQSEAVAVLRNVPPGGKVRIIVSRQDDGSNTSPRSVDVVSATAAPSNAPSSLPPVKLPGDGESKATNSISGGGGGGLHNHVALPNHHAAHQNDIHHQQPPKHQPSDDSYVYPWRQREILTLNIPVHDTEKAGLGVSVKGKTSASQGPGVNSSMDLGIFIKNVLHGGAASRDGRLRTNDQLLNVNGISLLGLSNAAAMETLRRAMVRTEGPVEGTITLTVARKIADNHHQRRDSLSSLLTDSSANTETFGGAGTRDNNSNEQTGLDNSGNSENSDNTVIFLPPPHKLNNNSSLDGVVMRNPVLERLTGQTSLPGIGNLHNESYYRATHQTTLLSLGAGNKMTSPTVNQPSRETVIIEEDSSFLPPGIQRAEQAMAMAGGAKQGRMDSSSSTTTVDATYASQLSLEEAAAGFSRDAFGRQSMSEKRHATLDAKNTDTYQRNKKLREERERQQRGGEGDDGGVDVEGSKNQLGPSLGMKKSSSLESLQTMVQEIQMAEDGGSYRNAQGAVRVIRGRGCNESFRAAVDRSYDAPLSLHELRMDTLAEDDGECALGPRQSSLDSKLKGKKKQSLLKGIGSMFRFGKHRKSLEGEDEEREREAARKAAREEQERIQEQYRRLMHVQGKGGAGGAGQAREIGVDTGGGGGGGVCAPNQNQTGPSASPGSEMSRTERIQQLRAQHQQRHAERRGHYPLEEREERYEEALRQVTTHDPNYGRSNKRLEQPDMDPINRPGSRIGISDPAKFSHYVNYQEIQHHLNMERDVDTVRLRRPRSTRHPASAGAPSADRLHHPAAVMAPRLTVEDEDDASRRQQHYHSQRRDNREPMHRPVSNFYEYESVQAVMRTNDANCNSLPRRPDPAPMHGVGVGGYNLGSRQGSGVYPPHFNSGHYYSANSNNNNNSNSSMSPSNGLHSLQPQPQPPHHLMNMHHRSSGGMLSNQRKPHGPFVTHVTIRECQQQAAGPKV